MLKIITSRFVGAFVVAVASSAIVVSSASAQSSGTVPATCTINAGGTSLTCTTTVSLSGVNGTFSNGALTLNGQAAGPTCSGGVTATPSSVTADTATAIQLNACPNNTNRSQLNFRWVSPANASGNDPWIGSATATIAAGGSAQYAVDVCASADPSAACTRVTATVTAPGASFSCGAVSPATQTVFQNSAPQLLSVNCPGATSYQWYVGTSPASGSVISGATQSTFSPPTANVGTVTYSVRGTNGQTNADSTSPASVTVQVQQPSGSCPAGEPRVTVNWGGSSNTAVSNFAYQSITGNGVHVTRVNVGAVNSSGLVYPPSYSYTQDDTRTYSDRRVTVSQSCDDTVAGGQVVATGYPTGVVNLVTNGDSRGTLQGYARVTPNSTWYIIVRNENCPAGSNCSFTGIYRNWGF